MEKTTPKKEKNYSKMSISEKIIELRRPIPFHYRLGAKLRGGSANLITPYVNARDVQDRLDQVFGPYRQRKHYEIGGKSYCEIGLYDVENNQWIWRGDAGAKTKIEAEKGEASDSFKRAGVNWGIGRFLYTVPYLEMSKQDQSTTKNVKLFVRDRYTEKLTTWYNEYKIKIDELVTKYNVDEDDSDVTGSEDTGSIESKLGQVSLPANKSKDVK